MKITILDEFLHKFFIWGEDKTLYKPNHPVNKTNGFIKLHAELTILFLLDCYVPSPRRNASQTLVGTRITRRVY